MLTDPIDFEIRMINKALGTKLKLLIKTIGIAMPKTRKDMDKLIGHVVLGF